MKTSPVPRHGSRSRILARLSSAGTKRIKGHLTEVQATPLDPIHEPNQPFDHGYFPEKGAASILMVLADGSEVEMATIG